MRRWHRSEKRCAKRKQRRPPQQMRVALSTWRHSESPSGGALLRFRDVVALLSYGAPPAVLPPPPPPPPPPVMACLTSLYVGKQRYALGGVAAAHSLLAGAPPPPPLIGRSISAAFPPLAQLPRTQSGGPAHSCRARRAAAPRLPPKQQERQLRLLLRRRLRPSAAGRRSLRCGLPCEPRHVRQEARCLSQIYPNSALLPSAACAGPSHSCPKGLHSQWCLPLLRRCCRMLP